jgi:hypothetical protein
VLKSLSERLNERRVKNAVQLLKVTPRDDLDALNEAIEAVKEAIAGN